MSALAPSLVVSEVFYSLQGEGGRAGEPSLFVRLAGCSARHACQANGVVCDTEFESGRDMSLSALHDFMMAAIERVVPGTYDGGLLSLPWIVWTGGEPLDQLLPGHVNHFRALGWARQAIETSGVRRLTVEMRDALDYVVVSPKVAEHILVKNLPDSSRSVGGHQVEELRYVRHAGQPGVPVTAVNAKHYCLSPHSDGATVNRDNLHHVVQLCLANPRWRLSVQQHKLWKVL